MVTTLQGCKIAGYEKLALRFTDLIYGSLKEVMVPDRSVSRSMTLSDLDGRDTRGPAVFNESSHLCLYRLTCRPTTTKFGTRVCY